MVAFHIYIYAVLMIFPKLTLIWPFGHSCILNDLILSCVEVHSCVHIAYKSSALAVRIKVSVHLFFDMSFRIFVLGQIDLNTKGKVKDQIFHNFLSTIP
jgi:hypothetical protein